VGKRERRAAGRKPAAKAAGGTKTGKARGQGGGKAAAGRANASASRTASQGGARGKSRKAGRDTPATASRRTRKPTHARATAGRARAGKTRAKRPAPDTAPDAEPATTSTSTSASASAAATPANGSGRTRRAAAAGADHAGERVQRLSPLRRRIAERLVAAQSEAALLTTFNEVDLGTVQELRRENQELFRSRYGVKLGLMSFFVRATVRALRLVPELNAELRGDELVYRDRHDVGIAVGGGEGLVVPVLRGADAMGFPEIERAIADYADRALAGRLTLEELTGGTFTISNGGVYGSLLSTPIVNPPQSGILGLHAVQDRPVVREGRIVVRPMMYVALTYDHRVVDGRQAVGFLRHVKEAVEDPMLHLM
jgi:2-oxoglutarate dehydrogenase E2 component (dihydrolipoamide succinyltransferase)